MVIKTEFFHINGPRSNGGVLCTKVKRVIRSFWGSVFFISDFMVSTVGRLVHWIAWTYSYTTLEFTCFVGEKIFTST